MGIASTHYRQIYKKVSFFLVILISSSDQLSVKAYFLDEDDVAKDNNI